MFQNFTTFRYILEFPSQFLSWLDCNVTKFHTNRRIKYSTMDMTSVHWITFCSWWQILFHGVEFPTADIVLAKF